MLLLCYSEEFIILNFKISNMAITKTATENVLIINRVKFNLKT